MQSSLQKVNTVGLICPLGLEPRKLGEPRPRKLLTKFLEDPAIPEEVRKLFHYDMWFTELDVFLELAEEYQLLGRPARQSSCGVELFGKQEDLIRLLDENPEYRFVKPRLLDVETVSELDPGIKDLVVKMWESGFTTTDSGDGVTKPPDEIVIPEAHVVIRSTPSNLINDANRLTDFLHFNDKRKWRIEASYNPDDGIAIIVMTEAKE